MSCHLVFISKTRLDWYPWRLVPLTALVETLLVAIRSYVLVERTLQGNQSWCIPQTTNMLVRVSLFLRLTWVFHLFPYVECYLHVNIIMWSTSNLSLCGLQYRCCSKQVGEKITKNWTLVCHRRTFWYSISGVSQKKNKRVLVCAFVCVCLSVCTNISDKLGNKCLIVVYAGYQNHACDALPVVACQWDHASDDKAVISCL